MRLELQKLKSHSLSEFNGSLYPGNGSPLSYNGRVPAAHGKNKNSSVNNTVSDEALSESEDI